jgi:hypothetical protein
MQGSGSVGEAERWLKCGTLCGMGYLENWGDDGRTCTECRERKAWESFPPRARGRNGRGSVCRPCVASKKRARRAANPEAVRRAEREYDRRIGRHRIRRYGIDRETWESLVSAQEGRCAVPGCGRLPRRRLVGDHCHKTGKFRGAVCDNCNVAMGLCGDSPEVLRALAAWIEYHAG